MLIDTEIVNALEGRMRIIMSFCQDDFTYGSILLALNFLGSKIYTKAAVTEQMSCLGTIFYQQ